MQHRPSAAGRSALVLGAALLVAACGDGGETAGDGAANEMDANLMLDAPANDASAMESTANVAEPLPVANDADADGNVTDPLGETSGGDTGGNTAESNISGM